MKPRSYVPQILAFAVTLALATGASADDHHHTSSPVHEHHVDSRGASWGHGDIRHFHDHDFDAWHGGHWVHDWHDNHFGWWWIVGGAWVFFNAPIYPYPDPYVPSTVIVQETPPPAPAAPPAPGPAPAYWYYCASAQNYYPYVTQCPVGWEQVPAAPAAPAQTPPPPPPGSPPPPAGDSTW